MNRSKKSGAILVLATCACIVGAQPVEAQLPEDLVFDGNILFDNDLGPYGTESGGAGCPGGLFTTTDLGTTKFLRNRTVDPQLNAAAYNLNDPRFDLSATSPALGWNGAQVVRASSYDPWFEDVCYAGAVPYTGGDVDLDWTLGWTYHNQNGGLGRTDIDLGKPAVMVTSDVTTNTTWTNANNYFLVGRIGVLAGATLTIDPGTVVMGSGIGSFLVIERGAQIDAQGTPTQPIIFTSSSLAGQQAPSDWGGIVIHGRAVANCSGTVTPGCGLTAASTPCASEGGAGDFGGADDDDSSGIIRYARVEYAGQEISPNNELNAWTFNAVGRNTVLEHLQADHGSDDGFEFFGGTARLRRGVATSNQDDNIDWQMGYRGFVQFVVVKQDGSFAADRGIEADNNEFAFNCVGRSNPVLANLTLVGTGALPGGTDGVHLRRGTAAVVVNSIIVGFAGRGLRIANTETFDNCAGTQPLAYTCPTSDAGPGARQDFVVSTGRNPSFGPTTIAFDLPESGPVTVRVFDAAGRLVDTVADGVYGAGSHALPWGPGDRAAGAYFFRVTAGSRSASGRLLFLR